MKTISQTEFQRNYKKYENDVKKESFIIFRNNEPAFVTVPFDLFMKSEDKDNQEIKEAINRFLDIVSGKVKTLKNEKA